MMHVSNILFKTSSDTIINNIGDPSVLGSREDLTLQEVENALDGGLSKIKELYLWEDPSTLVEENHSLSTTPACSLVNSKTSANNMSTDDNDKTGILIFKLILECIHVQFITYFIELQHTIPAL